MSQPERLKIALLQHGCPPGEDYAQLFRRTQTLVRDAADRGAKLIATQELFNLPYFPRTKAEANFQYAEPIPGPTSNRLCQLAGDTDTYLIASLFEKRAPGIFHNTAILIDPHGQIIGKYRKMHIPDDPGFYEKYYFTQGDLGWPTHVIGGAGGATIGMLICWDQWFPEAARLMTLRGAQLLFYPTAIAWCQDEPASEQQRQLDAWITVQRTHAITNGIFVVAINRVGTEGELTFWGHSFVVDPSGCVIGQTDDKEERALIVDCDLSLIDRTREDWPFLRDRRIDAYGDLTRRLAD